MSGPGDRDDDELPEVDDFDPAFDLDLEDEADDEDDELPIPEPPLEEPFPVLDAPEPDGVLPDVEDWLEDEDTDVWRILAEDRTEPSPVPPGERVILPWRVRAAIPALDVELPAILDPTSERSVWTVPEPAPGPHPASARVEVLVRLPGIDVRVEVDVVVGPEPGLRLGRDALAGRILVEG